MIVYNNIKKASELFFGIEILSFVLEFMVNMVNKRVCMFLWEFSLYFNISKRFSNELNSSFVNGAFEFSISLLHAFRAYGAFILNKVLLIEDDFDE